ncbi:hypothetical protein [Halochromatium glycolicum]|uniref:hypothetical protein n=1 Tax=Halochromatium glycolicum TaxID=85075 RepID=UPI00190D6475|nr:hypothetical protein [Halochromatium glycolicum]
MTTHPLSQKRSLSVGVAVFSLVLLGGCDQSPEMNDDEVSGEVQDAVEETREAADEAVEQTREALEETGDRIEEATD